jgi:hypothetical protein
MKKSTENFICIVFIAMFVCGITALSVAYLLPLISTFAGFKQVLLTYFSLEVVISVIKFIYNGLKEVAEKID